MRGLLVLGTAVAAVLVPAAPASTGATADERSREAALVAPARPAPPDPFGTPGDGCTVPVGSSLRPCPPDGQRRPPVSCVLPVDLPPGTTLVSPACPRPRPAPDGRVVPLTR